MIHSEQIFSDPEDSPFNRGQYQGVDPIFQSDPEMLDGEDPAPASVSVAIQGGDDEKSDAKLDEGDAKDVSDAKLTESDAKDSAAATAKASDAKVAEGKASDAKPAADTQKAPAPTVPASPNKK